MKWLGHQDSGMVRHYFHLNDAAAQSQMNKLDFTGGTDRDVVVGKLLENSEMPSRA